MDELFEKIQKLIAEKLEKDVSDITLDSSFRGDLGADSLDTYELVYAIEEEMGVSIPDEKLMNLKLFVMLMISSKLNSLNNF